jgi:hypothetical protein
LVTYQKPSKKKKKKEQRTGEEMQWIFHFCICSGTLTALVVVCGYVFLKFFYAADGIISNQLGVALLLPGDRIRR